MSKVIVTGGVGFIGSAIIGFLNKKGYENIIIVDQLDETEKWQNLVNKNYHDYLHSDDFLNFVENKNYIEKDDIIIHMGACSATTELNSNFLMNNNTKFSWVLYNKCKEVGARFIYASSAATYGNGSNGYDDSEYSLRPLNMYGYSKYLLDNWVIKDTNDFKNISGFQVVGLKFFNVYGPNEYHKGKMSSVIFHGFNQIKNKGEICLFKSYKEGIADGEQKRDFIYIKDVLKVVDFFINNSDKNGIYNVGSGTARSFKDLAVATFSSLGLANNIRYIDMPEKLRDKYQYYTKANIDKLRLAGFKEDFYSLENGVDDYIKEYLNNDFKIY